MKIPFKKSAHFFTRQLLRRAGYGEIMNREGQVSYARVMGASGYPRFHAYIDEQAEGFTVNLHLDQKKPVYEGQTAHNGEYEGTVVEREGERLAQVIRSLG